MDKNINISGTSEERLDVFFSESTKNLFVILQLRYCDETADEAFENLEHLAEKGMKPDFTHYEAVYVGEIPPYERRSRMLEDLFYTFNMNHPGDFRGHSMSVSDVVLLKEEGEVSSHFVDSFVFTELEDFLPTEMEEGAVDVPEPSFTYAAVCYNSYGEVLEEELMDDPVEAIETWFKFEARSPLYACITIGSREAAVALAAAAEEERITRLYEKYRVPYKLSFLLDEIRKQKENGCHSYLGPGDSICPFDMG